MKLSVARAKDRVTMTRIVYDILAACEGGNVRRLNPAECISKRVDGLDFTHKDGLAVTIEFDGESRQGREGTFCMAWHTPCTSNVTISEAFGNAMQALVNPYHHGKCTAFGDGFDDLCAKLEKAVALLNSGEAYRTEAKVA